MTNSITLTNDTINSGTAVKLLNSTFTYGFKNMTDVDPTNGGFGITEVQFWGWENPKITLTFHIPIDNIISGFMTWSLWNEFAKNKYDGTSGTQTKLNINVGGSDTAFADYSLDSTSDSVTTIPVQVDNFKLVFGPGGSNNSAFWSVTATFMVTK